MSKLSDELANDPLGRGYAGLSDEAATADGHLVIRDAPASGSALLQYLTLERFRTGTLYGRLQLVALSRPVRDGAMWSIPPLPIGVNDADIAITQEHIASAAALLRYADTDFAATITLLDSRIDSILDDLALAAGACEAMGAGDKAVIQALSQNQISRWSELGIGGVRVGDVTRARA